MDIKKLYAQEMQEHYKHPRNKGRVDNSDFTSRQHNPSCGDIVSVEGTIVDSKIKDIGFEGEGCVISMATASMLTEKCKGMTVDEVLKLDKDFVLDIIKMELGPSRLKCALLTLQAIQEGLELYKVKNA